MQAANQLRHFYAISDSHALPDDLQGAASLLDAYKFSLINHKSEEAQDKRAAIAALVEKQLMSKRFTFEDLLKISLSKTGTWSRSPFSIQLLFFTASWNNPRAICENCGGVFEGCEKQRKQ